MRTTRWDLAKVLNTINEKQIKSLIDLNNRQRGAYNWARKNKVIEQLGIRKRIHKYTEEDIFEFCKKFDTKLAIEKENPSLVNRARELGIFEKATEHCANLGNALKRKVYILMFNNKFVYIGLTKDIKQRLQNHRSTKLKKYFEDCSFKGFVSREFFDAKKAQQIEKTLIEKYKNDESFKIINVSTGGALGWAVERFSINKIKSEIKAHNIKTIKQLRTFNESYYRKLVKHKLLNEVLEIKEKPNRDLHYFINLINKEKIKDWKTFRVKHNADYLYAKRRGLTEKIISSTKIKRFEHKITKKSSF